MRFLIPLTTNYQKYVLHQKHNYGVAVETSRVRDGLQCSSPARSTWPRSHMGRPAFSKI